MSTRTYGRISVDLSNQDKLYYPGDGITKGDVINYYERIADVMLPHISNRPLSFQRFPDGIEKDGFFQQQRQDHFPDWIQSHAVARQGDDDAESIEHVIANNKATLVYLANQGVLTIHHWLSTIEHIERPDMLLFDLDPPGNGYSDVVRAAKRIREVLESGGFNVFVMTTGSTGLHIASPIHPEAGFDEVRSGAQTIARILTEKNPDQLTTEQRKDKREGRVYLDVQRIAYGQTKVAPYSLRPYEHAPIATPLDWDELAQTNGARDYSLNNIFRRLAQKPDPWKNIHRHAVDFIKCLERLK